MYNNYKYTARPYLRAEARNIAQRGVAAIEFALVFPVFFVLLYGIITYTLIFVAEQSLTMAAEEGARAALQYTAVPANRNIAACNTVAPLVSWLGNNASSGIPIASCTSVGPIACPSPPGTTAQCITVSVTYPYAAQPLVPLLLGSLMNVAVPANLGGTATVQID